jgi:predicted flavoprotein YhiN
MSETFDVAVIGAGAAGMMCASVAGQRGRRVVLIDHSPKLAEKIRISGGGRCNFTNTDASWQHYLSQNPHFARSALARYTPQDFIALVNKYRIPFHEKHKGQLLCDRSDVIVLTDEAHRSQYDTLALNMRGYNQNLANGNNAATINNIADDPEFTITQCLLPTY